MEGTWIPAQVRKMPALRPPSSTDHSNAGVPFEHWGVLIDPRSHGTDRSDVRVD